MERDDEPYSLFYKLLEYNGVVRNENSKHGKYFPIFAGILLTSMAVDYVVVIMYILEDHQFDDKAESFQCLVSLFHILSKVLYYRFAGRKKLRRLLDESVAIWKEMRSMRKYEDFLDETRIALDNRIKFIQGIFILTTPTYGLIVFTRNLTLEPEEREFVFKIWDPLQFFIGKDYYYACRLVYEATLFTYALFTIGSVYLVYFIPCYMASVQMRFLIKMLSSEDLDVTVCVRFHQKILRFVRNINELFSGQMFFEIILSALPITFRSYQLIMMLTHYDPRAVGVFFFLILCFLVPLLVCVSGQMISDASDDLFIGTYQNKWYRLNVKDRKSLSLMMTTASIPLNLCYRNTMTFNMDRYMAVVQATYSYITILINYN